MLATKSRPLIRVVKLFLMRQLILTQQIYGLGPSRTLVLVNGKEKSKCFSVNDTPGKGEVGTDMKSIPFSAIERVEVLRDGASAQYGSDAIAGSEYYS
jgi:outer membrane receptor for ferrienterochelin and colicin